MNRTIRAIILIVCALLLIGGLLEVFHPDYGYRSELSIGDGSISYLVSSFAPAEYNILFTENNGKESVDTLYIYYDEGYGSSFPDYGSVVDQMESRFSDRGMKVSRADTMGLKSILSVSPWKVGLVMGAGTIPEEVAHDLLLWIQNGGTVYWTYDVMGQYLSRSDGTYYTAEISMQADFLGSQCTVMERVSAVSKETATGYTQALGIKNKEMLGSLDLALIEVPYLSFGYQAGDRSEVVLLQCGSGTICVISGDHDMYQITDTVQVACAGLTERSELKSYTVQHTDVLHGASGSSDFTLDAGREYVAYSYVSGLNPPYGKTARFVP